VKMYDKDYNPLFAWTLPEVKKELNPVLVSRLFDVYGEKLFMSDLLDPKTTNPRAVNIRRDGDKLRVGKRVIDYVPSRVKHTDEKICDMLAKAPRFKVRVPEGSILKDFYSEIDSHKVGEYVTVFDSKGKKLFSWNLPEVKKELDPLLLYRLYETQGNNLAGKQIPKIVRERPDFDDSDSIHIGYHQNCITVQGYKHCKKTKFYHAIEYVAPRLKITDFSFDHVTKNQLTWSTPYIKEYHPSIVSFIVTDTSVKFFDGQDELLFTWEPKKLPVTSRLFDETNSFFHPPKPTVTWADVENLRNVHGNERIFIKEGPKQVVDWCERNFPQVNYLRIGDDRGGKTFLAGYKNKEPVFSIDIEK